MSKVLFVCTGNAFRSLSAEFALRSALPAGSDVTVASAGIRTTAAHPIHGDVRARLTEKGSDISKHVSRQLTQDIFDESDLVVAMGTDHLDYIQKTFGKRVPLYMEIVSGRSEGVPDNWEVIPDHKNKPVENQAYIYATIDMIFNNSAAFAKNMQAFMPRPAAPSAAPKPPAP
jgi:protein-tyrosine-phosphatase